MSLRNKDSVLVVFTNEYDAFEQNLKINFKKAPSEQYTFELLPGALIDFFEKANDTLSFKMATKSTSDYGNLTLNLKNIKQFPIIVELTDAKGKVLATEYSENNATIVFEGLEPNKFMLRVIYDDNKNKVWDAGNYLEKRQSETVIYFPSALDVRANWDVNQDFDLGE
jgi:hypothetical protein